jgi:hypothetical protein
MAKKSSFQILTRNPKGGLRKADKDKLDASGVKVDLKVAATPTGEATDILREFQALLPKSISMPDQSPFMILQIARRMTGALMECRCECGLSHSCSGGGGGGT